MEMWELVAREQIRDTLARYNWSGDAGRVDDLAETFCRDGVLEIRGFEPLRGRAAIAAFLRGVTGGIGVKPIVRHNVSNVLFTELRPGEARVRSYFTVVTHIGLDHCGRYRDLLVPDGGGVADQTPRGVHRLGGARLGHGPVAPAGRPAIPVNAGANVCRTPRNGYRHHGAPADRGHPDGPIRATAPE